MWHTKMHFSAKCNSGRIAIQWLHIKHYLDYQYAKSQPYTFRVPKMSVFARYATLVPRLSYTVELVLYIKGRNAFSFLKEGLPSRKTACALCMLGTPPNLVIV